MAKDNLLMLCVKVGSKVVKGFAFRESDTWTPATLMQKIETEGYNAFRNLLPVKFTPCDMSNFKSGVETFVATHSNYNLKLVYLVDVDSSAIYRTETTHNDFENVGITRAKWTQ